MPNAKKPLHVPAPSHTVTDTVTKPYIDDRDENIFIGMMYPLHGSDEMDGMFASTTDTISAVKHNIKMLLYTKQGERFFQPTLGLNLHNYAFEQFNEDLKFEIQEHIVSTINYWLPFVEIQELRLTPTSEMDENNKLSIFILFNIKQSPNTLESVQVEIGGE